MGNIMDKIKRMRERNKNRGRRGKRTKGIFLTWRDGDNQVRLAGNFLEVRTHFIAGNAKRRDKGFCINSAFEGEYDDRIPKVVNCADWDIEREEERKEKTCVICRLGRIADTLMSGGHDLDSEEKEFLKKLGGDAFPRTQLKWNVLDRDNPHIIVIDDDGNEKQALGFKIASFGMDAWRDMEGFFQQLKVDIANEDDGVDLIVTKGSNGARTTYNVTMVMDGYSVLKTPFTPEERALEMHDLKQRCGTQTDQQQIHASLHPEFIALLEEYAELLEETKEEPEKVSAAKMKTRTKTKAEKPKQEPKQEPPEDDEEFEEEEFEEEEEAEEVVPAVKSGKAGKGAKPVEAEDDEEAEDEEAEDEEAEDEEAEDEEAEAEEAEDEDEFSDPTSWECFGEMEVNHPECKQCDVRVQCAEKSGVELAKGKKGKRG